MTTAPILGALLLAALGTNPPASPGETTYIARLSLVERDPVFVFSTEFDVPKDAPTLAAPGETVVGRGPGGSAWEQRSSTTPRTPSASASTPTARSRPAPP